MRARGSAHALDYAEPGTGDSVDASETQRGSALGFRLVHDMGGRVIQNVYGWAGQPVGPPSSSIPRRPFRVDQRLGFRLVRGDT